MIKTIIKPIVYLVALIFIVSCEQERLEAELEVAPGGGTLTTFKAYTIASTDPEGANVYGRIVFWKDNLSRTLVQVSLYNTIPDLLHPALILGGSADAAGATLIELDTVSGDTGELVSSKFFIITDTAFYDSIDSLDAHINIYLSSTDDTIVASGNLGANAEPVASN